MESLMSWSYLPVISTTKIWERIKKYCCPNLPGRNPHHKVGWKKKELWLLAMPTKSRVHITHPGGGKQVIDEMQSLFLVICSRFS
jgi:hypothetical protein